MDWANLNKYAEANKKLKAPVKGEKRVVFMGDSITEFWKVFDSSFWNGRNYINRGISGQTTSQMLIRFQPDVIALKPDAVVILAGINDIAQNTGPISIEDIFANIVSMTNHATNKKIKVILCSVLPAIDFPWRPGMQPADKVIRLNGMIRTYCIKNHIAYVDYYSNMVDAQKGLRKELSDDGVHPTIAGYRVMEPIIETAIKQIVK